MKIFVNGNFKTLNGDDVEALVCDEKIYYAGTTKEALRFDGNVIDLKGKTILPGFLDLTTEFLTTVYSKAFLDISKVSTVREIIFLIENRINNKELIIAYGYDQNKLDRELSSLDIEFENPVLLIHRNRDKDRKSVV